MHGVSGNLKASGQQCLHSGEVKDLLHEAHVVGDRVDQVHREGSVVDREGVRGDLLQVHLQVRARLVRRYGLRDRVYGVGH